MGFNNPIILTILWGFIVITRTIGLTINEPLIFSNYPEGIKYPQVIFSESVNSKVARIHYYHQNQSNQLLFESISIKNNDKTVIVVNKMKPIEQRLRTLAISFLEFDLNEIYMVPALRAYIEESRSLGF